MTSALDHYTPALDREKMKQRYEELCRIRDKVNAEVEPLKAVALKDAAEAEEYRVKSMISAQRVFDARGGHMWTVLKKEIGLLAKVISGTVPPKKADLDAALEVMKGR